MPLSTLGDHQRSIRDLVFANNDDLANHINFDSFGRTLSETNAAVDSLFGYTNREFDEETGLQYNRARYYSPELGRFISQDPSGFSAGDHNLYRYAGNSPLQLVDPSGLYSIGSSWWQSPRLGIGAAAPIRLSIHGPAAPRL